MTVHRGRKKKKKLKALLVSTFIQLCYNACSFRFPVCKQLSSDSCERVKSSFATVKNVLTKLRYHYCEDWKHCSFQWCQHLLSRVNFKELHQEDLVSYSSTRAALKVMPPILCWLTMPAADVGGMAAGIWYGCVHEIKVCSWIPPWGKNGTHWHSLMLAEHLWRQNSVCEYSEAADGAFQQWQQQQWVTTAGADLCQDGMQALVHCWQKSRANCEKLCSKTVFFC